jgi:hypothetical protein
MDSKKEQKTKRKETIRIAKGPPINKKGEFNKSRNFESRKKIIPQKIEY